MDIGFYSRCLYQYLSWMFCNMLIWKCFAKIQLGIDAGSSTVARGVVNLVVGYLNNMVTEMAFLIQVKIAMSS